MNEYFPSLGRIIPMKRMRELHKNFSPDLEDHSGDTGFGFK
jgi:hypothetical protein